MSATVSDRAHAVEHEYRRYLGIMFRSKMKGSISDSFISSMTGGQWDHVDLLFVPPAKKGQPEHVLGVRRQTMRTFFTAYMRDPFRGYESKDWSKRKDGDYLLLLIDVTEEQYERAR